jgi:hypothetical protein
MLSGVFILIVAIKPTSVSAILQSGIMLSVVASILLMLFSWILNVNVIFVSIQKAKKLITVKNLPVSKKCFTKIPNL